MRQRIVIRAGGVALLGAMLSLGLTPRTASPAGTGALLIGDGDFEANATSTELRNRGEGPGWYESRRDGKEGRALLQLSQKPVAGNTTRKAMIKASPTRNTYLTQQLVVPQTETFSLQWDILVKEILLPFNRTAFQLIGNASVRGRGPNGAGRERFVFLGFESAAAPGRMNLFAFEGGETDPWDTKRVLISGLELGTWHTVRVTVDVPNQSYTVEVPGAPGGPVRVAAFRGKGAEPPTMLTHLSFASWNDGPGTFYVDNVR